MRSIPDELVTRYKTDGWWTDDTIGDLVARGLAAHPDLTFRVHSDIRPWSGTFRDVEKIARRLAGGLRSRGVGPGDVVAFQLPNCMEAAAVFWASSLLGVVVVPIVHIYGRKELTYILGAVKPKVFIGADGFSRAQFHADLCEDVPITGVVGRDFEDLLDTEEMAGLVSVDAASPVLIAYTSGTTSNPKGVVHSHQTLGCESYQLVEQVPPDAGKQLTVAPVGHFIGMVNAFLIPVMKGRSVDLLDVWKTETVLSLMRDEGLSIGGGVPFFFTSLVDHPDFTEEHRRLMRYAGMGGSTVPVAVTERLASLGVTPFRSYGSTEHPSITGSAYTDPESKRLYTDGKAMPGVEIKLNDAGEIFSRGPDLCLGYTDPELTARAFDEEGWYRTGDVGSFDEDGYITITDRISDFIIRGGENISALEVEEVLLTMDGVAEAAAVAVPDQRLGERVAAVVSLKDGRDLPSMEKLREHFAAIGLAKQKWPEELHIVEEFPRTASGKLQKYVLRNNISASSTS